MLEDTREANRPARRSTRHGDLWQAEIDVALVMAVRHGHADAARALLERGGANPEVANSQEGLTPLMMASKYGHIGVVIALLDAGARIDARDRDGRSAEDVAAELGREGVVELLRDARRAKGEL